MQRSEFALGKAFEENCDGFERFRHAKTLSQASNGSISTMAPEDASECGEHQEGGLGKVPRAWSSVHRVCSFGPVSPMHSDLDDPGKNGWSGDRKECSHGSVPRT